MIIYIDVNYNLTLILLLKGHFHHRLTFNMNSLIFYVRCCKFKKKIYCIIIY